MIASLTVLEANSTGWLKVLAMLVEPENRSGFPFTVSPSPASTDGLLAMITS